MKKKPLRPRSMTALLKIRAGAADAEYAQAFVHWHHLFNALRLHVKFEKGREAGSFKIKILGKKSLKNEESYLIIDAVSGTFVGILRKGKAISIGGRLPLTGRQYYLTRMGQA